MFFKGKTFCLDDFIWMNQSQNPVKVEQTNALFWFMDSLRLNYDFDGFHKVYKCTLKILTLENINLSVNEFDILTSSNTIEKFVFHYSTVKDNEVKVPVDIIFGKLPNIVEFSYLTFAEDFSFQTFVKMNELNFFNKFQVFTLWMVSIKDNFDPDIVCKFIEKNAAPSAKICLAVNLILFKQALEQAINNLIEKWEGLKPSIKII
uniref:Uncharacterized protein n=1 Tax=Panagrolaimus sp. PS1159 TaxID=55785 RepID=A0AC35GI67_9BILA